MPLRIPTVAGIPPLIRTIDSRRDARAMFAGYGNPDCIASVDETYNKDAQRLP